MSLSNEKIAERDSQSVPKGTLVVGGTGLIGAAIALRLLAEGRHVTIAARSAPALNSAVAGLPFISGDYAAGEFTPERLAAFETVIFAAGNDIRHRPPNEDEVSHMERTNSIGVPAFFAAARDAGVRRAVLIGTFYPQILPDAIDRDVYVGARHAADMGARALSRSGFDVMSVNPPFVIGHIQGIGVEALRVHVRYALGLMPELDLYAIPGGANFMSSAAVAEAAIGALERGQAGKAYLVGDENLSFRDYFNAYRRLAGLPPQVPLRDQPHPLLPDPMLYAGRGANAFVDDDPKERQLLGYRRGDIERTMRQLITVHAPEVIG